MKVSVSIVKRLWFGLIGKGVLIPSNGKGLFIHKIHTSALQASDL